jgi:hypothetical protein
MFFSRAHNNPSPQTRLALEQALGTVKKQEDKMAVVGDLVDTRVDGPTRIDFSEQVRETKDLVYTRVDGPTRIDFSEQVRQKQKT